MKTWLWWTLLRGIGWLILIPCRWLDVPEVRLSIQELRAEASRLRDAKVDPTDLRSGRVKSLRLERAWRRLRGGRR